MTIKKSICKKRLTLLWFSGAGFLFLLLILQTVWGHFGEQANEAWGWLLPSIMPTLSLIIGVLVMSATEKGKASIDVDVDGFVFWLSFFLSFGYLAIVCMTIMIQPFTSSDPVKLMRISNLWLGPLQGLVSASLGAFFVSKQKA